MNTISISYENIDFYSQKLKNTQIVLYGAGSTGKQLLEILRENDIKIAYFCDDDENKWGMFIEKIPIISYDQLIGLSENTIVIITSIYAKKIYRKLNNKNFKIMEMFAILENKIERSWTYSHNELDAFQKQLAEVMEMVCDKESVDILTAVLEIVSGKISSKNIFFDLCTEEEHYFTKEVIGALDNKCTIIDCGAYTGDILHTISDLQIDINQIYAFEANEKIFVQLNYNIAKSIFKDQIISELKGIWSSSGELFIREADSESKLVETNGVPIEVVSLDDYFKEIAFDFLKMDIEGAEMEALQGGINVIKKNRPILAISIYHSVEDYIKIPLYLRRHLNEYKFFIRHHSLVFCETVLYGIPKERFTN